MHQIKENVFIVNRNLLTSTKKQVEWFQNQGLNPTIIDNDSTYPDLLDYYSQKPCKIIKLNKNVGGCNAIYDARTMMDWDEHLLLVTDSDLDLSSVKPDWKERLLDLINRYPEYPKVGFSLSLADLPDNELSAQVVKWEAQFWQKQIDPNVYIADLDSTFAVWRQQPFDYKGLRLGEGYTAKHIPWHLDPFNLDDEWKYYLRTISPVSTWGSRLRAYMAKHQIPL